MTYHQTLALLTPAQRKCLDPFTCVLSANVDTDQLPGTYWCRFWRVGATRNMEGEMVRVLARGRGKRGEFLVFLSNGQIFDLDGFFGNFKPVSERVLI